MWVVLRLVFSRNAVPLSQERWVLVGHECDHD